MAYRALMAGSSDFCSTCHASAGHRSRSERGGRQFNVFPIIAQHLARLVHDLRFEARIGSRFLCG